MLGAAGDGRPVMVASFTGGVVERGLSAAEVVKEAARLMGGGGGGRDTMAQAGGKDAGKLERGARGGTQRRSRRKLATRLDAAFSRSTTAARAAAARSATRPAPSPRRCRRSSGPRSEPGLRAIADIVEEQEAARVVVGLPVSLSGEEGAQAAETRAFAAQLRAALDVPVET